MYELHRARHLEVTDPRDRIFAMLGHFSLRQGNKALEDLQAHYDQTVAQVYTNVRVRALTGDESLITLAAVQHMSLSSRSTTLGDRFVDRDTLPSWAPNWDTYQTHILSEPVSPHRAHGHTVPKLSIDAEVLILRVQGVQIDTVSTCSAPLAEREFHIGASGHALAIESIWRDVCGQTSFNLEQRYVHNTDSALLAYMQTLSNGGVATAARAKRSYHDISTQEWLVQAAAYLIRALGFSDAVAENLTALAAQAAEGDYEKWSRAANGASKNRVFARTEKGYFVLGPKVMEEGDVVCVLHGGKMPFALRPCGGGKYLLVGECYVHGIMDGEFMGLLEREELIEEAFEII